MKTIDKVKAYCVINEVTMCQVSQFYKRKGDAVTFLQRGMYGVSESYKAKYRYAVAEFVFDRYYIVG
jgi:hypothetical protein